MSHFTVLVIGDDVDSQLAPFHEFECTGIDDEYVQDVDITKEVLSTYEAHYKDEYPDVAKYLEDYEGKAVIQLGEEPDLSDTHKYGYAIMHDGDVLKVIRRTNPRAEWDWYIIGGRWTGFFKAKEGATVCVVGEPGVMTEAAQPGYCDQIRKGDIDFDSMREAAAAQAAKTYDEFYAILNGREHPNRPAIRAAHENIVDAREVYNNDPVIQDFHKAGWHFYTPVEFVDVTRAEYMKKAADGVIQTFAVIKDGVWYQKGVVTDEKDPDAWSREFSRLIDDLPDDTLLTVVDCHI